MSEATPKLAELLDTWQAEVKERVATEAAHRKLAASMLGRLIDLGVDDLRTAGQAVLALQALLSDLDRIDHRESWRGKVVKIVET